MSGDDVVIQTEHLADEAAEWLGARCTLFACPWDDAGFTKALATAAGLVVRTYTRVDASLLDAAPQLRVVGRAGAGLDNIDVAACRARGIEVVYAPDANTQSVVEYVIGLLARVLRTPVAVTQALDRGRWTRLRGEVRLQKQMSDLTLGILGMGRIGGRLAEVASAIGFARVLFNDVVEIDADRCFGASPVTPQRLFAESDVISVHVDGRSSNRRFVGAELIGRMPPHVIFVNTSRGFVVDSLALAAFLREHPAATALLDVHDPEPFGDDYPLLGLSNALLYPHLGASTERADRNMSWVVKDVVAVLEGRAPRYPAP